MYIYLRLQKKTAVDETTTNLDNKISQAKPSQATQKACADRYYVIQTRMGIHESRLNLTHADF